MDWLLDEEQKCEQQLKRKPWKIVIVDDEPEIHKITELALRDFEFENRPLQFINAYDGKSACELFKQHDDIALVLLDVVMESDDAGLRTVEYLRDELGNHFTRVVLRTGQPGMAPEHEVISHYDIDGYRAKTELTHESLTQTFYTTLRAYRDLSRMQRYQHGLEAVIRSIAQFNELDDFSSFTQSLMEQVGAVLNAYRSDLVIQPAEIVSLGQQQQTTCWNIKVDNGSNLSDSAQALAQKSLQAKQSIFQPPAHAYYHRSAQGTESVFVIQTSEAIEPEGERLLAMFSQNVVLILERLLRSSQIA